MKKPLLALMLGGILLIAGYTVGSYMATVHHDIGFQDGLSIGYHTGYTKGYLAGKKGSTTQLRLVNLEGNLNE